MSIAVFHDKETKFLRKHINDMQRIQHETKAVE